MIGKHDRASELRAIADGRLLLNVRNGVTVSRSMLAMIADELDATTTRLAEVEKALNEAADALDAAMEDVEHWGAYAGEYFQDKHDLDGDLARISEQATAARRALTGGE